MAFGYDGSVRIKADLNHSNFDRGLSYMTKQVNTFGSTLKKIGGMVAIAFGTAALVNFAKESIKLASDIQEVQNVIDVTFGNGAAQIEEFAQTAAEAYGLSELAAKQYTGTMGAMLKSSGLSTSAAQEMSMALTGLAGDIASFYNLDTDTAFEKIRAGISGETEPLKQLGINMSVANLEAYALSKGITKSYSAMSQAEQVLLRYNYLLSVTTDAQGDFARTSGSFANQIRILQLNFDQLRISVGNALIPIAEAVLPSINAIIAGLTKLANVFAKVTALLFGKSPEVKATSGIAASAGAAADATDKLAESTAGAGSAAKQAEKDMKGVLASFDELNILASNAAGSVGGAGGGGGGAGVPDLEIPSYEAEIDDVDQLGEAFESLGELFVKTLDDILAGMPAFKQALLDFAAGFNEFNQKLYDAFTFPGVKERVEELGRELADAFNGLVNAINWELWGRTLGAGLNLGLQFLTEFLYTFDWINLGKKFAEFINGLVYEIDWYDFGRLLWTHFKLGLETFAGFILGLDMPALAQAASDIIMGFFDSMQESIANIDWDGIGRQIAEFLNNIDWVGVINSIAGAFQEMVGAALEMLGGFIQNADPDTLLVAALFFGSKLLRKLISNVLGPIAKEVASNLLKKIADSITNGESASILTSIGTMFSTAFSTAKNAVGEFADKVSIAFTLAKSNVMPFSEAIQGLFGPGSIIAGAAGVVGGAILAIGNFLEMLSNGFNWVNEALMLLGVAIAAVGAVILGVPATVAAAVAAVVAAIATAIVVIKDYWAEIGAFFSQLWEGIKELAANAWDGIVAIWEGVASWFSETIIQPLSEFFTELWENISQFASDCWDAIVGIWESVSSWFNETVIEPVSKFFTDLWDGIKQAASDLWGAIVSIWESAGRWFEDHVTKPIGDAFDAVGNFIKNVLNGVIGGVEALINGVIKGINWLISQLNKIKYDVPDWVPAIGGKKFGFNISSVSEVKLPRLANGAVIPPNQQFAAILGDQRSGVNIEAPLSTIEQALENVLMRNGGFGGATDINVNFTGSLSELARILQPKITAETRRRGINLAEVRT